MRTAPPTVHKIRGVSKPPRVRRDFRKTATFQGEATRASPALTKPKVLYSPGPGEKVDPTDRARRAGQKTFDKALVAVAVQLGPVYPQTG